jgi:hypothetical protein
MAFTETVNGALGVGVSVGVEVGGTSEKFVAVGCRVIVGFNVTVSVTATGVGVQVGPS